MKTNKIRQGIQGPKRIRDLSLFQKASSCWLIAFLMIIGLPSPIYSFTFPSQRMRMMRFEYTHHTVEVITDAWRHRQFSVSRNLSTRETFDDNEEDKEKNSEEDETLTQIQKQQKQIDFLMNVIQKQSATKESAKKSIQEDEEDLLPKPLPGMFDEEEDTNERSVDTTETLKNDSLFADPIQTPAPLAPLPSSGGQLPPLKTMLFIDGTWFYYSLYRRKPKECPICQKYGVGWQYRYRFDWNALPRVICEQLVEQQENRGWSSSGSTDLNSGKRPIEIVRASVFTSFLTNTRQNSNRAIMFKEMADANYDIHMLPSFTQGKEKCVDISLAVDMVHFATVPNAFDVALLLSGDKDFIPAMVRTRQKGKKVGLVSMRRGCNQDLYDTPHVKDFDVVWIEEFLDQLMVPLENVDKVVQVVHKRGLISSFTSTTVILDFISKSPNGKVSSRDMGVYLKSLKLPDGTTLSDDIKLGEGGLRRFLMRMPKVFEVSDILKNSRDKNYWISRSHEQGERQSLASIDQTTLSSFEKKFLQDFRSGKIGKVGEQSFMYTCTGVISNIRETKPERQKALEFQKVDDISSWTVVKLKEKCKELNLPVSGTKAVLFDRIVSDKKTRTIESTAKSIPVPNDYDVDVSKHIEDLVKYYLLEHGGVANLKSLALFLASNNASSQPAQNALEEVSQHFGDISVFLSTVKKGVFRTVLNRSKYDTDFTELVMLQKEYDNRLDAPDLTTYLENVIQEYIKASGGVATSRNIGRYLQANTAMKDSGPPMKNALQQLKSRFGPLLSFLRIESDRFSILEPSQQQTESGDDSFRVRLL